MIIDFGSAALRSNSCAMSMGSRAEGLCFCERTMSDIEELCSTFTPTPTALAEASGRALFLVRCRPCSHRVAMHDGRRGALERGRARVPRPCFRGHHSAEAGPWCVEKRLIPKLALVCAGDCIPFNLQSIYASLGSSIERVDHGRARVRVGLAHGPRAVRCCR